MKAIHVSTGFKAEKFALYNTVISALTWRKYNGEISLICDSISAESLGVLGVWNSVSVTLDDMEGINPLMFWAAGKLLALREISAPVVMLDMDFIVWKKLELSCVTAAHREDLYPDIYPDVSHFKMKTGYTFNPAFDYTAEPFNTAFLYLPDQDFKQFYVNMAIEFMKSAIDCNDYLRYMVYAEQRMLALCAEYLKQPVQTLLDKDKIFEPQDSFTHLWGAKQQMRDHLTEGENFCQRCKARIRQDFPKYEYVIDIIERI
jgi:hypothetical protein